MCPACGSSPPIGERLIVTSGLARLQNLQLQILGRRIVARIDRVLQEFSLVIGPELADVWIALDDGVDQAAVASRHLSDIDVADHIAEFVELDEPAYCV